MTESPYIGFRAYGPGGEGVVTRAANEQPLGQVAQWDLGRYYRALSETLKTVHLTEAQASLIVDACNGAIFEPHDVHLLWANVDDAIQLEGLDQKWNIAGPAIVKYLRGLTYAQMLSIIDAAERFWLLPGPFGERLRLVGLVEPKKG